MGTYDVVMLAILGACTLWGLWRGVAWQLAAIASIVVSYLVALRFSPQLAPLISEEAPWNRFAAMLVLYLATSLAVWLVFRGISSTLERIKLKEFDHQIGALFGLFQGVLLCTAVTFFVVTLSEKGREAVVASRSGYYIARFLDISHPLIPDGVHQVLHPYFEKLHDTLHSENESDGTDGRESSARGEEKRPGPATAGKDTSKPETPAQANQSPLDDVLANLELLRKAQSGQELSTEELQQLQQVMQKLKTLAREAAAGVSSAEAAASGDFGTGGMVDQLLQLLGSQTLSPFLDPDEPDRSAGTSSPARSTR